MKAKHTIYFLLCVVFIITVCSGWANGNKENQMLKLLTVHSTNPRYFTDGSGKAIYLTGSHTWANLQDIGLTDPPPVFNWTAYLDFMRKYNHNFMRMWAWEQAAWAPWLHAYWTGNGSGWKA